VHAADLHQQRHDAMTPRRQLVQDRRPALHRGEQVRDGLLARAIPGAPKRTRELMTIAREHIAAIELSVRPATLNDVRCDEPVASGLAPRVLRA